MILISALVPLLYVCFINGAYAIFFRKRYAESLAPAFFVSIILMLFSGMLLGSITLGILISVVLAIVVYVTEIINAKAIGPLFEKAKSFFSEGLLVIAVYLLVNVINYGKHYHSPDEFTHWGVFLRETFRLDALYVTSPIGIVHKDYVPAITLFEALWCKLSFRLTEANAYRGIQMLQVSMLLPLISNRCSKDDSNKKLIVCIKAFVTFSIPLFVTGLMFYHTIYQDYIYGVLVFFCMWIIVTGDNSRYELFELTLAITILLMAKMTALAFLPMIVIFYVVYSLFYMDKVAGRNNVLQTLLRSVIVTAIPLIVWKIYNVFSSKYIGGNTANGSGGQSYGGHNLGTLIKVFSHNGSIAYQNDVEKSYLEAIISRGLVGNVPYVQIVVIIVALLLAFSFWGVEKCYARKVRITSLWILLAGLSYGLLMYYLYMTGFSEFEARQLASYDRYMGTFVVTAIFLALGVVFYFTKTNSLVIKMLGVVLLSNIIFFGNCEQILPGNLTDSEVLYNQEAEHLKNSVPENAKVAVIIKNEMAIAEDALTFYSFPITIGVAYPNDVKDDLNRFSYDYSDEELAEFISEYDYVYFMNIDEKFIDRYSDIFEKPEDVKRGEIYQVTNEGGKIVTY
ncbi:hypothetical protein SAMN02910275_02236 [Butyrivibrio sp. INlla18]|uniref:hypothetical protein n=1 Tax=Butyrivibrio sp. INlla18 TaxID=1520806 RepID=UPI000884E5E1|nr:hypothetical protein [Butyrivibrio sp. INlla18]SDA69884.1 hypothetical protein SAMN02910275_02236 [Butyrivibrio sp. INlla18]